MPFPPIPRELDVSYPQALEEQLWATQQNVSALFLYLQRLRDQSSDEISTVVSSDPSLGGNAFLDSNTIDFTVGNNQVSADVLNDSSIQKVEIASNNILIGIRKRVNFIGGVTIIDNPSQNRVDATITSAALSRLVTDSLVLTHTQNIICSRYFEVQGILELNGDATLEVI